MNKQIKNNSLKSEEIVNQSLLRAEKLPLDIYSNAHKSLVITCHDIAVEYRGGIILVTRDNNPAKSLLWPIGGRVERGMTKEDSMIKKVKEESGLLLKEPLIYLGQERTFFQTDPFNHGRGTDTDNARYFARAEGKLVLDAFHSSPVIVKPENYTCKFRATLMPYVRGLMDLAIPLVGKPTKWLYETKRLIDNSIRDIVLRSN